MPQCAGGGSAAYVVTLVVAGALLPDAGIVADDATNAVAHVTPAAPIASTPVATNPSTDAPRASRAPLSSLGVVRPVSGYRLAAKADVGLASRGLRPLAGTRVRPQGVPEGWRIRGTKTAGGTRYYDPANSGNSVRVM